MIIIMAWTLIDDKAFSNSLKNIGNFNKNRFIFSNKVQNEQFFEYTTSISAKFCLAVTNSNESLRTDTL